MSNQVQFPVFNFNSSAVRVIIDPNQEPWFCGADVCRILGYVNESLTLQKHCKENGVSKRYLTDKMQRQQKAIFINEPNLYRLIIKSRKPEAEKFEAWVFEEVLPQIRKTGKYALQNNQQTYRLHHRQRNTLSTLPKMNSKASYGLGSLSCVAFTLSAISTRCFKNSAQISHLKSTDRVLNIATPHNRLIKSLNGLPENLIATQ